MNTLEQTEARRQQAHRRLRELEVAVGLAGEPSLAWHIRQALRNGASRAEVQEAVRSGMVLAGQPTTVCSSAFTRLWGDAPFDPSEAGTADRGDSREWCQCLVAPAHCGVR